MGGISVELNAGELAELERRIGSLANVNKVVARAANRVAENARTEFVRESRKRYVVKYGEVKSAIKLRKATTANPAAFLEAREHLKPLIDFKVTPKRPVLWKQRTRARRINGRNSFMYANPNVYRAAVKTDSRGRPLEGNDNIPKAFVQNTGSGLHVMRRIGNGREARKLYGPSVPQMLGNEELMEKMEQTVNHRLRERIEHEVEHLLQTGR